MADKVVYSLVKRGEKRFINIVRTDYPNPSAQYEVLGETPFVYLVEGGLRIKKTLFGELLK